MKFKSRTALAEHLIQLQKDGYLIPDWQITETGDGKTHAVKVFRVNFEAVNTSPNSKSVSK